MRLKKMLVAALAAAMITGALAATGPAALAADGQVQVYRAAGQDRFETAAVLSLGVYPDGGAPVVYVASGVSFPDALSAGPAAIHERGVILLSRPGEMDPALATALDRLSPERIVVVGGTSAISASVFSAISAYAPGHTVRIGGADRFETSRKIVENSFCPDGGGACADAVFVASGANFPDALSAGPAAGLYDDPLLLVRDDPSGIDPATASFVTRLGVQQAALIGGTAALSDGVERSLNDLLPLTTIRVAGVDRFDTAVQVSIEFFESSQTAFIASGAGFPDALAAGPVAGAFGAPFYLSRSECLPDVVYDDLGPLGASDVVLVGGYSVLSPALDQLTPCGFSAMSGTTSGIDGEQPTTAPSDTTRAPAPELGTPFQVTKPDGLPTGSVR
jgi:putative cell wall-binding protein